MTATPEQVRQASDPATPAQVLSDLASAYPELQPTIALNPKTYEGLLDWLRQYGDASVQAALATRTGTYRAPTEHPTFADSGWREPGRSVPLSWGTYELRYGLALVAAILAGLVTLLAYTGFVPGLLLPFLLLLASVVLLPAPTVSKVVASALVVVGGLITVFTIQGSYGGGIFSGLLLAFATAAVAASWLVARQRPAGAFGLLALALIPGVISLVGIAYGLIGILLTIIVIVGIAWLGRAVAASGPGSRVTPEQRAAADHAARVEHLRRWEAAYAEAHGGARPPAGYVPPMSMAGLEGSGGTNTMAILALVFGLGGGLLGIVFGHMALSQIRRTGEQGRGLAIAGLVFGYIGLAAIVVSLIVYFALLARGY